MGRSVSSRTTLGGSSLPDSEGDFVVRDLVGYATTTDYLELWNLSHRQSVVCIVDYKGCRDVAQTVSGTASSGSVQVLARGIMYLLGIDEKDFAQKCDRANLKWLYPESPAEPRIVEQDNRVEIVGPLGPDHPDVVEVVQRAKDENWDVLAYRPSQGPR